MILIIGFTPLRGQVRHACRTASHVLSSSMCLVISRGVQPRPDNGRNCWCSDAENGDDKLKLANVAAPPDGPCASGPAFSPERVPYLPKLGSKLRKDIIRR